MALMGFRRLQGQCFECVGLVPEWMNDLRFS